MEVENLKNQLIRVTEYRGSTRSRVVRVIEVRNLNLRPINFKTSLRRRLERSKYLITVHDLDKNLFRSYYHLYLQWKPMSTFTRFIWRIRKWWEEN